MKVALLLWLAVSIVVTFAAGWLLNGFDRLDRVADEEKEGEDGE